MINRHLLKEIAKNQNPSSRHSLSASVRPLHCLMQSEMA
jgi:hypothetical protein